jgi:RNA polymerase sigma factor (sigma-70 family)
MDTSIQQEFLRRVDEHRNIIHKISRVYMDTQEDREDLCQEIIIQLWKSYGSFRNESSFSTWMYRVAVNTAITFFKKGKLIAPAITLDEHAESIADDDDTERRLKLSAFYKAVHTLNNIEKALIFLYLEGQSHKDIAEKLGISEVNARVKLNRTKQKLQDIIKNQ